MQRDSKKSETKAVEGFLQRLLRGSHQGLWEWDCRTDKVFYSARCAEILGIESGTGTLSFEEWIGLVHLEDRSQLRSRLDSIRDGQAEILRFEYRVHSEAGNGRWILVHAMATRDATGSCLWVTGSQSDISERKRLEKKVFGHSFFDALTGLPNRDLLLDRARQRLASAPANLALIVLGIDRSREIRDSLGLEANDRLLVQLARYLRSLFDERFTLARIGTSRFALLLEARTGSSVAMDTARSLAAQLPAKSFQVAERRIPVTISLGVVDGRVEYSSSDDMLRDALTALETARSKGREQVLAFEPSMRDKLVSDLRLEQELRSALEDGRIRPVLQPLVSLETGKLVGFEALGRLWLEDESVIAPRGFLPLAEEIGKIGEVDRVVLRDVCRMWKHWRRDKVPVQGLFFSVNASPQLLSQSDLIPWLDATLRSVGMPPNRLVLEVTEKGLDWDPELVAEGLLHVHSLGVRIALDGFGRGRFDLARFQKLPFELVKIDQRAVDHPQPELVLSPLLQLIENLGLKAVIQGLETRANCNEARRLGCALGQGFFLSEPLIEQDAANLAKSVDPLFRPEPSESSP